MVFVLIVMLLGEPDPDFAERRTRTEQECQQRAADYNRRRGWKAYCAASFLPVKPEPVCASCGLLPGRKRV